MEREFQDRNHLSDASGPPPEDERGWHVLWTGLSDGAWNMAVDEWLMATARQRPPTVRIYGWRYPTVSLGRNERWRPAVNPARLARAKVRLVRRPTGGRAVLHHRELTYSVTASVDRFPALGGRLEETLERIAAALVTGLARAGVSASVVRRSEPVGRQKGACFESSTRFELVSGRGKLVGSAQYRTPHAFLQHGSIPAYPTLRDLYALSGAVGGVPPKEGEPEVWSSMAPDEMGKALVEGFADSFGSGVVFRSLGDLDGGAVADLVRRRYAHAEWTFRR